MKFSFSVLETDEDTVLVASPQVCAYQNRDNAIVVEVLFMENAGASITNGFARPAMGKTILEYEIEFPGGAVTASIKLFKIQYVFPDSKGMSNQFEFKGKRNGTKTISY